MPDSNANLTRSQIVTFALKQIGNTNPSADEQVDAARILNAKLKELDEQGVTGLWTVSSTPSNLTLVSGQATYAVGDGASEIADYIQDLVNVEIVEGGTLRPLRIIGQDEALTTYERETNASSEPYLVYLEKAPLKSNQVMRFLPTPNAAYSVQYYFRRMLYDFDAANDNPDFPPSWNLKLIRILAAELAPFYMPLAAGDQISLGRASEDRGRAAGVDKAKQRIPQIGEYF